jgi:spectinomycin phosphotransferase
LAGRDLARDAVLCHGDPHLGNVLLGTDEVWLVDWDDAVRAPRERDLILAVGGVLTSWAVTAQQRDWFAQGYGPLDLDADLLHFYACMRAMEDVVGFAHRVLDTERFDRTERLEAVRILRGVLSADGIGRLAPDRWTWPPA